MIPEEQTPFTNHTIIPKNIQIAEGALRVSLALAFLYPPIAALFDATSWISYFPEVFRGIVPDLLLLHGFGAIEVVLALWILFGKKLEVPAGIMAAILLAIVVLDWRQFSVLFRDVSIAAGAISIIFINRYGR